MMSTLGKLFILFAIPLLIVGCRGKVEEGKMRTELTKFWEEYKQARMSGDIETAMEFHPRGHRVLSVSAGEVRWITYDEAKANMKRQFKEIKDLEDPIITISSCGCCAIMAGRTRFVTAATDSTDEEEEVDTWISTYTNDNGGWQQVASSNSVENPRNILPGTIIDID